MFIENTPNSEFCQDYFFQIFESVITDQRLSDGAFDTLLYISSHSKGFVINQQEVANHSGTSRRTIARRFQMIIEAGYMESTQLPGRDSRFKKFRYSVNNKPQVNIPNDHYCNMSISGLARDASIPSTYKRIMCIVLTYPGSFNITPEYMSEKYGYHITTVEKAFKIGIEKGYMHRTRLFRNNGKFAGYTYAWNNRPIFLGLQEGRAILPDNVEFFTGYRNKKTAQEAETKGNHPHMPDCHAPDSTETAEAAETKGNHPHMPDCPHKDESYINFKNKRTARVNRGERPPLESLPPEEQIREEQIKIAFEYLLRICGKHQADNLRMINKAFDAIEDMIDVCPDIASAAELVKAAIDRVKSEIGSKSAAFVRYNFLNWINDGLDTPRKIRESSKTNDNPALNYEQREYAEGELDYLIDEL